MENLSTLLFNLSVFISGILLLVIIVLIAKAKPNTQPITCSNLYAYMLKNHHEIGIRYFYEGFVAATHDGKAPEWTTKSTCQSYFQRQGFQYANTIPDHFTMDDFRKDFTFIQTEYLNQKRLKESNN